MSSTSGAADKAKPEESGVKEGETKPTTPAAPAPPAATVSDDFDDVPDPDEEDLDDLDGTTACELAIASHADPTIG
jgi:peroxin-19